MATACPEAVPVYPSIQQGGINAAATKINVQTTVTTILYWRATDVGAASGMKNPRKRLQMVVLRASVIFMMHSSASLREPYDRRRAFRRIGAAMPIDKRFVGLS
jgi:hypothetical protein